MACATPGRARGSARGPAPASAPATGPITSANGARAATAGEASSAIAAPPDRAPARPADATDWPKSKSAARRAEARAMPRSAGRNRRPAATYGAAARPAPNPYREARHPDARQTASTGDGHRTRASSAGIPAPVRVRRPARFPAATAEIDQPAPRQADGSRRSAGEQIRHYSWAR